VGHLSWDVGEDFAPTLVDAQHPGSAVEACML
jgi:hypothetical protein